MDVIVVENTITDIIESYGDDSVIEVTSEDVIEYASESVSSVEIVTEGPQGPPGMMADGANNGDLIRWNAITESWEARQEPFEFKGIVLTPQETAILETEGALYYSSADKTIKLCVGD
jgi:hypothetical protein